MKELGLFSNKAGRKFVANFYPHFNEVEILGPVAEGQSAESLPQVLIDVANSEEEAIALVKEKIELF